MFGGQGQGGVPMNLMGGFGGVSPPMSMSGMQVPGSAMQGGMPGSMPGVQPGMPGVQPGMPRSMQPGMVDLSGGAMPGSGGVMPGSSGGNLGGLQPPGSGAAPSGGRQVNFASTELAFYQNLYNMVDCVDGNGEINGPDAAAFLAKSGLPKTILHQIWQLSDVNETGKLNLEDFYVALRLVAHAQGLGIVHPDLVQTEPQTLPSFEGLAPKRTLSEPSEPATDNTSVLGGLDEVNILNTDVDPARVVETQTRLEAQNDFIAKAQRNLSFTVTEQILYSKIYESFEPENGEVVGSKVSEFLESSNLPRTILHEVWSIADETSTGKLSRIRLFVLLRLIAHAQAMQPGDPSAGDSSKITVSPQLQFVEPPSLPVFDPLASSSEHFQSVLRDITQKEPGAFYIEPLSLKDKKKYASIFVKTANEPDLRTGFVEGEDAKTLMQRSKLPNEFLAIAWQLADRDSDGRLNLQEFLVAMHLITRCKKGDFRAEELAQLPTLQNALPGHLEAIFQEPVENLGAIGGSTSITSTAGENIGLGGGGLDDVLTPTVQGTPQLESLYEYGSKSNDKGNGPSVPGNQGNQPVYNSININESGVSTNGIPSAQYANGNAPNQYGGAAMGTSGPSNLGQQGTQPNSKRASFNHGASKDLPKFGLNPDNGNVGGLGAGFGGAANGTGCKNYLEDICEADKKVTKKVRQEVDYLEEVLKSLNDRFELLERDTQSVHRDLERKRVQKEELMRQDEFLRGRVQSLTLERRNASIAAMQMGERDRMHEEMRFLEDSLAEATKHADSITEGNTLLEKQFHEADLHLQSLEKVRRELTKELTLEKESLKREERENSLLKTSIEQNQRKVLLVNTNIAMLQSTDLLSPKSRISVRDVNKLDGNFRSGAGNFGNAGSAANLGGGNAIGRQPNGGNNVAKGVRSGSHQQVQQEVLGHSWAGLLHQEVQPSDGVLEGVSTSNRRVINIPRSFEREGV